MAESLGIRGDPVGGESRIQGVLLLLEEPPPPRPRVRSLVCRAAQLCVGDSGVDGLDRPWLCRRCGGRDAKVSISCPLSETAVSRDVQGRVAV